jgi:hypothetical protein
MSEVLLGTCGWSYAEWEGILYPYGQNKLKQYSSIFATAEIASTFYGSTERGNGSRLGTENASRLRLLSEALSKHPWNETVKTFQVIQGFSSHSRVFKQLKT